MNILLFDSFYHGAKSPSGPSHLDCRGFAITLGRTPLDE